MSSEQENRQWRKEQRARLLAERLAMPRDAHRAACAAITKFLAEDLLPQIAPKVVGAYSPIRGEYDCRPLLSALHKQGVKLALPVIVAKDAPLEFHAWKPGDLMKDGPMNIPQPSKAVLAAPDCLLIPVAAFDAKSYRLCYGAGFYDRTLAQMNPKPVTIGTAFSFQRVEDIRPHAYDLALDYIVTEEGVQRSGAVRRGHMKIEINGALIDEEFLNANIAYALQIVWMRTDSSVLKEHTHCVICNIAIGPSSSVVELYKSQHDMLCGYCFDRFVDPMSDDANM